jgi:hypothetical protein
VGARGDYDSLLLAIVGFFCFGLLLESRFAFHQDAWLGLVAGREVWHSGVPHHEQLTVLARGTRWIDQQWLSQLALYAGFRLGDLPFLAIVHAFATTGALAGAIAGARRLGASARMVLLLAPLCGFLVLLPATVLRTQTLAYPLFVAVVYLLARDSRRPSPKVWWALALLVVWGNVHGSAILGAALVSLRGLTVIASSRERAARPRAALLTLAPAALLVTPYGFATAAYYSDTLFNHQFAQLVTEWRPVTSALIVAVPFFGLAGLAIWAFGRDKRRLTAWEWSALLVLIVAAITAGRNVVWMGLAGLMLVPIACTATARGPAVAETNPRVNRAFALLAAVAAVIALAVTAARPPSSFEEGYPGGVLRAVRDATGAQPDLRVFADSRYADWLLWREPALEGRVAFDVRFELLRGERLTRIARGLGAIGVDWKNVARGFRLVVLTPTDTKYATPGFRTEPGRRVLFDDTDGLVLLRTPAAAR